MEEVFITRKGEVEMNGHERSKTSQFFGQFAEPKFYLDLAQTAIKEVLKAAALAFAGTLTHHIQRKFNGEQIAYPNSPMPNQSNNSSQAATRAFGVTDTTDYRRTTPTYNPSSSSGAQAFPGFGSR